MDKVNKKTKKNLYCQNNVTVDIDTLIGRIKSDG